MTERVTREQKLSIACPHCSAPVGAPCVMSSDSWCPCGRPREFCQVIEHLLAPAPHRERRQAFLDKQAGEAREGEE